MNAKEVGTQLVEMYNGGKHQEIMEALYSPEIKSHEADGMLSEGMDGLKKKYEWWEGQFQVNSTSATGPFPHGEDQFAVIFHMDTTHKESGQQSQMDEIAVYTTKDGKIVEERFFYTQ